MPLVPLEIPAGVYRNGTEFQASNRWYDASLVRWIEGTMRPVGGWSSRKSLGSTAPRAALAWTDQSGDRWYAAGFHNALKVVNAAGTLTDITPADLVDGTESAAVNTGYGNSFYGLYEYGKKRPNTGNFQEATTWSLDNWGGYLVGCSTADGRLLEWTLNVANNAAAIANAPTNNKALVVTDERFLFALGAGGNRRKVQWSDRENNTVWTPDVTNEAGDLELQTNGQIMLGIRTRGQTLIITDMDAHAATYQGPPFVYGIQRVGSSCGAISRRAAASVDEGVFWMGARGFHVYAGDAVQDLPCEVSDYVFGSLNTAQITKVYAVANSAFNEIWWFYPSDASKENNRYVSYNYAERHWSIGEIDRTAGVDAGVFDNPIWFNATGRAYDHEKTGEARGGALAFAESGPISLGAGDNVMSVMELIPDENTRGDVRAIFKTRFYPNDTLRQYGPYSMAAPTSVRFSGRQVQMRVEAERLADWRVGVMRLDLITGGRR
jgi:hypothetical protein